MPPFSDEILLSSNGGSYTSVSSNVAGKSKKQIIIAGKIIKLNAKFSIATFDAKKKIIKVYKNTFGFKLNILGT